MTSKEAVMDLCAMMANDLGAVEGDLTEMHDAMGGFIEEVGEESPAAHSLEEARDAFQESLIGVVNAMCALEEVVS